MQRALVTSPVASARLARAEAWLAARPRGEEVLVVGASHESATDLTRRVAREHGASFGWYRATLARVAAALAGPELAARGIAAAGSLPLEAICARVVDALGARGELGRLAEAAGFPNLPRALARTLGEVRLAGLDPARLLGEGTEELGRIHQAYEAELDRAGIADRALVLRIAIEAARGVHTPPRTAGAAAGLGPILGRPLLLVDVPVTTALERDLVAALAARAPEVLATVPAGDEQSLQRLREALGVEPEPAERDAEDHAPVTALRRLQTYLFAEGPAPQGTLDGDVTFLSAPGESRECVEVARLAQQEAARGVPFDRMAILLRAPLPYRAHLEEALRRAGIPAHFARGSVRPDSAGRAFVALLACGAEKLSARRFAEYLSLGQVPDATIDGAPPPAIPESARWVPPDDEIVRTAVVRGAAFDALDGPIAAEERFVAAGPPSVRPTGSVPAPRRWERLLIESAVLGGIDRWNARLDGLHNKLTKDLAGLAGNEPLQDRVRRSLDDLASLRRFALPLLRDLELLPRRASWGEWTTQLSALATRALRKPERVLAALAELLPMAAVGPVTLDEVRLVLGRRLTDLVVLPEERAAGHIFVAPVEAARGLTFDVVFVPGLAEKLFPQKVSEDPILLDRDRDRLALGLDTNEQRVEKERLALRLAVGAARERIVLSYPRVDMDQSRPRVPSFYGLEVIRAAEGKLPGFDELARRAELHGGAARIGWPAPARLRDAIDDAEYDLALLETLFHRPEAETVGSAHYLLGANPHLARALRFRARRWNVKKWMSADGLVDPGAAARAALSQHTLSARAYSATALQTFSTCPYKFLLYAVHRLTPREAPEAIEELGPRERGALVHEVLYETLDSLRQDGALPITQENLDGASRRLDTVLARTAARYEDELAPAIERVWKDGIDSVLADLREWLRRAAEDATWTPRRFELSFGLRDRATRDPSSLEASVELDCGILLRGAIDLVEEDASGALRATDYKTGRALPRAGATIVNGGGTLQPVLYALALEKLFPEARVEAGRLYYCTSAGGFEAVSIPLDDRARRSADTVARVIGKALSEGFLPAAPDTGACEYCEYRAVCGPYEELRTGRKSPERLHDLRALRKLV